MLCYFVSFKAYPQQTVSAAKILRTAVYYTFEGAKSLEEVDLLRNEIQEHKAEEEEIIELVKIPARGYYEVSAKPDLVSLEQDHQANVPRVGGPGPTAQDAPKKKINGC